MRSLERDYYGGAKNYNGEIPDYKFVLDLKEGISFERFAENFSLEDFLFVHYDTNYAGSHLTDPNWYEEGKYKTGILRANLYVHLEKMFRQAELLDEDQVLRPRCHYSDDSGKGRSNLVIEVSGGERDSWGQVICCFLGERRFFELVSDPVYLQALKQGALKFPDGKEIVNTEL
jgi:hypothetical protein